MTYSQPYLSAITAKGLLTGSDLINLLQEGKTLSEIARQTGLPTKQISKLLKRNLINYDSFKDERQHIKFEKIYSKCYALAVRLNRLPHMAETLNICSISFFRSKVYQNLRAAGFHNSGRYYLPNVLTGYPVPQENIDLPIPPLPIPAVTADKKEVIQLLGHIAKDLGSTLSNNQIVEKVSQNLVTPCFSLPPFFSQEKMKFWHYNQVQKKKKKEKLLSGLISISNQLGYSPGKGELRKKDKSLYMKLYRAFGGLHNALKEAGLNKKIISQKNNLQRTRNEFIEKLKQNIQQSGKIPAPGELQNLFGISIIRIEKLFTSYAAAIKKAGFSPPLELAFKKCQSNEVLISRLRQANSLLGRPLKYYEFKIYCGNSYATYRRRFGSVNEAHRLVAEGLFLSPHQPGTSNQEPGSKNLFLSFT
jgi:hypothetical protein